MERLMLRPQDRVDLPPAPRPRGGRQMILPRVDRADWLIAGFEALMAEGPAALQPARLSDRIGGAQVSFFWHFHSAIGFHAALLHNWEQLALGALAPEVAAGRQEPRARLSELATEAALAASGAEALEAAIRAWGLSEPMARAALGRVDRHRLEQLTALLEEAGLPASKARERAEVFYAARVGFDALRGSLGLGGAEPMQALTAAIFGGNRNRRAGGGADGARFQALLG